MNEHECICYAIIALINIIEQKIEVTPDRLYDEMSKLFNKEF